MSFVFELERGRNVARHERRVDPLAGTAALIDEHSFDAALMMGLGRLLCEGGSTAFACGADG